MPPIPKSLLLQTGVYKIVNAVNGKVYIGSAGVSLRRRNNEHYCTLRKGQHTNNHLQNSWNKYGENAFEFIILERCSPELCLIREQFWIDFYDSANEFKGYNITPTAGSLLGTKFGPRSDEVKAKMKEAAKKRNAKEGYNQLLRKGIKKRNAHPDYIRKLTLANKIRELNSGYRTGKVIQAMRQHLERGHL